MTVVDIRWAQVRRLLNYLMQLERQVRDLSAQYQMSAAKRRLKEMRKVRSAVTVLVNKLRRQGAPVPHWIPELREEPAGGSSGRGGRSSEA